LTLTEDDSSYVRELVRREAAIVLDESKGYLIEARLTPVARAAGVDDIAGLVAELKRGAAASALRARVVQAMTTNETSFFRDVHPFDALASTVLPALAEARSSSRSLRLWSAASSTGQEAYSIAIVALDRVAQLAGWDVHILGTDLAEAVLTQAREGRYAQLEVNRGLPANMLTKFFERDGAAWRVTPELQSLVDFSQMNLVAPWPPMGRFDVVFLRNVLIYFDVATKRTILERIRSVLAPDGYLFLGASEMMTGLCDSYVLEKAGRAMWYRPAPATPVPGPEAQLPSANADFELDAGGRTGA
jgi:chemotaxis protein methyltransferase CheR